MKYKKGRKNTRYCYKTKNDKIHTRTHTHTHRQTLGRAVWDLRALLIISLWAIFACCTAQLFSFRCTVTNIRNTFCLNRTQQYNNKQARRRRVTDPNPAHMRHSSHRSLHFWQCFRQRSFQLWQQRISQFGTCLAGRRSRMRTQTQGRQALYETFSVMSSDLVLSIEENFDLSRRLVYYSIVTIFILSFSRRAAWMLNDLGGKYSLLYLWRQQKGSISVLIYVVYRKPHPSWKQERISHDFTFSWQNS